MEAAASKLLEQKRFYRFGSFRLNPEERVLLKGGAPIQLTDRAFDLLVFLVRNHGHLLRKDKIILEVWPDAHVGDNNLHTQISTLRRVLGAEYIETVEKHGYRFTSPVTEEVVDGQAMSVPRPHSHRKYLFLGLFVIVCVTAYWAAVGHKPPRPQLGRPADELYRRALAYERQGDDEQAIAALDQALALEPSFSEACVRAAFLSYELENDLKASAYLSKCSAARIGNSAVALQAQALTELLSDNSTRSIELFQLLIDRYPNDPDSLYRFAEVATDLDRLPEAANATDRCIAIEAENPYCRLQRMYISIKENKFADVLLQNQSLPPTIRDYPWFDEAVGVAFMGNGQLDQAKNAFERLSARQATVHGTSHFTIGKEWTADLLLYRGRVAEAIRRIEQIMETTDNAPSRSRYLVYLGQIYALLDKKKEAQKAAAEVANTPSEASDFTGAALVLATIGDHDGVNQLLKLRARITDAGLPPGADHQMRGTLALAHGNIPTAVEELRLAHDLKPRDEEIAFWLARAYMKANDYESALAVLNHLEELRGTILLDDAPLMVPLISYRKAECYLKVGDLKSAATSYAAFNHLWNEPDDSAGLPKLPLPAQ